jgi:hypothetical protein
MLDCHWPGKAVSEGPEQVVFLKQDCAKVVVTRGRRARRWVRPLMIAIASGYLSNWARDG